MPERSLVGTALRKPFDRGGWFLVKGAALVLLSVLVLPAFVLLGYMLRVAEAAVHDEGLPPLEAYDDLFVDGLKAAFLIGLPVVLVAALPLVGGMMMVQEGTMLMAAVTVLGGLIFLVGLYLLPAMMVTYALERDLSAAYDADRLQEVVLEWEYLGYLVLYPFVSLFVNLVLWVATIVSVITVVGPFIMVLVGGFYRQAMTWTYLGRVYARATQ